jgi:ABC-type molybdate transport system substrate-binding protein
MKSMLLTGSFSIPISSGSLGHFGDMIEKIRAFQKQTGATISVQGGGSMTLTKAANANQIA